MSVLCITETLILCVDLKSNKNEFKFTLIEFKGL